ncbi:hypothetical protein Pelo_9653 [Pelomyxa schiedti]|nr:hypothetical protein Pelo_9653 [Pelomyxa schiedti]
MFDGAGDALERYTTAKSQVLAMLCSAVGHTRSGSSDDESGDNEDDVHMDAWRPTTHPVPSLISWVRSADLFREWAENWVLRPDQEAVFLPLKHSPQGCGSVTAWYLYVSVSPTLGVIDHFWNHCDRKNRVCGCVGHNRLLVSTPSTENDCVDYYIEHASPGSTTPSQFVWSLEGCAAAVDIPVAKCNTKWIVIYAGLYEQLHVWRVVGGSAVGTRVVLSTNCDLLKVNKPDGSKLKYATLEFCLLHDNTLMIYTSYKPPENPIESDKQGNPPRQAPLSRATFVDLEESHRENHFVFSSKPLDFDDPFTAAVMRNPGGTLNYTLHYTSQWMTQCSFYLKHGTTSQKSPRFPQGSQVSQIGPMHLVVFCPVSAHKDTLFSVYNIENDMTSLCVPCTWASPSIQQPSSLILATSYHQPFPSEPTEMHLSLHEGVTGVCLGMFSFVVNPDFFLSMDLV